MSATAAARPCRECSECAGEHHWLADSNDVDGVFFVCKHCDETCEAVECEACDEFVPSARAHLDTEDAVWLCDGCAESIAVETSLHVEPEGA